MTKRRATGLPTRLLAYFKAHPDEELDYPLICAQYDVPYKTALSAVASLVDDKELESVHVIRRPAMGRAS